MVRVTSIEAYNKNIESGYIGKKQSIYYTMLLRYGPCTANELAQKCAHIDNAISQQKNVTTRLGELRDMGAVKEHDKKICSVTGRKVISWIVTNKIITSRPRPITSKQKIARLEKCIKYIVNHRECSPTLKQDIFTFLKRTRL